MNHSLHTYGVITTTTTTTYYYTTTYYAFIWKCRPPDDANPGGSALKGRAEAGWHFGGVDMGFPRFGMFGMFGMFEMFCFVSTVVLCCAGPPNFVRNVLYCTVLYI